MRARPLLHGNGSAEITHGLHILGVVVVHVVVLALVAVLVQLVEHIKPAAPKQQLLGLIQHVEVDTARTAACTSVSSLHFLADWTPAVWPMLPRQMVAMSSLLVTTHIMAMFSNTCSDMMVSIDLNALCLVHVANAQIDGEVDDN